RKSQQAKPDMRPQPRLPFAQPPDSHGAADAEHAAEDHQRKTNDAIGQAGHGRASWAVATGFGVALMVIESEIARRDGEEHDGKHRPFFMRRINQHEGSAPSGGAGT